MASTRWCGMRRSSRGAPRTGSGGSGAACGARAAAPPGRAARGAGGLAVGVGVGGRRAAEGLGRPRPVDRHRRALDGVVAPARARVGQREGEPVATALAGLHDAEVERVGAGERAGPGATADLLHAQHQRVGEPPAEAAGRVDQPRAQQREAARGSRRRWRARCCRRPTGRGAGRRVMIACEAPAAERHRALGSHPPQLCGPFARGRRGRHEHDGDEQQEAGGDRARVRQGPAPLPSQTLTGTVEGVGSRRCSRGR